MRLLDYVTCDFHIIKLSHFLYFPGEHGLDSIRELATTRSLIVPRTTLWFRRKWIAAILICWALLECYTRLYLGVHYPSDIVFGIVIGSLISFLTMVILKTIRKHRNIF